jgi:predicted Rossmann fold nucleotide-binding protein DprA/Smf involved in DNA uptake
MKLAVVGSRSFSNRRLLDETLAAIAPMLVISGGAVGADKMAETWARRNNIETRIFLPRFKVYRHPYHHRNRLIAEACDEMLAFWDGHSTGTKYTIDYARKIGKPVRIVRF